MESVFECRDHSMTKEQAVSLLEAAGCESPPELVLFLKGAF
jgi:hypothetical protein